MKYFVVGFLSVFTTLLAHAGVHQLGTFKVESIRFADHGTYVRFNPAPNGCEGGESYRMHAVIPNDNVNADKITSALLAAYTADMRVQYLWFSNEGKKCSETHILNLEMIEFKYK